MFDTLSVTGISNLQLREDGKNKNGSGRVEELEHQAFTLISPLILVAL